jgi:hypothetical protein
LRESAERENRITMISHADRAALLAFVDANIPAGCESVSLTGSRARGDQRPESDWDVLVLHPDAPERARGLRQGTITGSGPDGNRIEVVTARPHRLEADSRPCFADCKRYGIRLR